MRSKGSDKKLITAAELVTQLEQNPEFSRRREEREKQRQQVIEINRQASLPILVELAWAGFSLNSISDLYSERLNYRDAIPILLRWLPRVDNLDVKEAIVRALSVPWAKPSAASALIEEFRKANDPRGASIKWAIANALSIVADDSVFTEIVELVQDKGNGKAREMLAIALGNMKDSNAVRVLIDLLDDDEVFQRCYRGVCFQSARPGPGLHSAHE